VVSDIVYSDFPQVAADAAERNRELPACRKTASSGAIR
jgi:hypothetical protein